MQRVFRRALHFPIGIEISDNLAWAIQVGALVALFVVLLLAVFGV